MLEDNKKISLPKDSGFLLRGDLPARQAGLEGATKHEIIRCERCRSAFECKANSFTKCQCAKVQLTLNETQYVSELHDGCLCASCLLDLQKEYQASLIPG